MLRFLTLLFLSFLCTCARAPQTTVAQAPAAWASYDQSAEIAKNADNPARKLRYQLIQSRISDRNVMLDAAKQQLGGFSETNYQALKPMLLADDLNIPKLQEAIRSGDLTYESLTKWYLYRIVKLESNRETYLNAIISINPDAVAEARQKDRERADEQHPIYGMPVLLKDNVNFASLPTTAGAHALRNNMAEDAFITDRLQDKGAIILGKTNLSEWANYLCAGCPNGYSAVGGQTLNPYRRKVFDTGGSSSGSGAAMAANYAVVAVGTETSGSILSPSSQSSLVGLKPTVGLLSRSGIVPISSTLDTPGPMTRNVVDNAILLSALSGKDPDDPATDLKQPNKDYLADLEASSLKGKRFGVLRRFMKYPLYAAAIDNLAKLGADTLTISPPDINLDGFGALLNADMRVDLAAYLAKYAGPEVQVTDVASVIAHNAVDTTNRIPYGQARFLGIVEEPTAGEAHQELIARLLTDGVRYFDEPMTAHRLDAVLSINNYSAGFAAAAHYPALTVPMGYSETGAPFGLTFIGRPFAEDKLLQMAYGFERGTKARTGPKWE